MSRIRRRPGASSSWHIPLGACLLAILAMPVRCESLPDPVSDLRFNAGRSFGHVLGDLIRHEIQFKVVKPYRLEKGTLPHRGPIEKWLELRDLKVGESEEKNRYVYRIEMLYQIFPAIREPENRRIPGLRLRLFNGGQSLRFHTPDTTVIVTPLIPGHIPDSDIEIRPAIEPAPIPLDIYWRRITNLCLALLVVSAYLAWRYELLPFFRPAKSPFDSARREIAKWRHATPDSPEYRNALLSVHRALNQTAGQTVFASDLERFFNAHPLFDPMKEKTAIFFTLSHQVFFARKATVEIADYSARWLEQLCREYHKIERNRA